VLEFYVVINFEKYANQDNFRNSKTTWLLHETTFSPQFDADN